jgi:succinate-semialdehyde dehydrogenase/glutarate-semialdehyde dehydrogenase
VGADELGTPASNLIDGNWVSAISGRTFQVCNPADDTVISDVPACGEEDVRVAVDAADRAFASWSDQPAEARCQLLTRLADAIADNQDFLASLITREAGKTLSEARGEAAISAGFIRWAAEEGKRVYGDIVPASTADKRLLVLRQPIGVVAAITPWNFPIALVARKLGPCLATGCTMVLKPAEQAPLSALALGELAMRVGIPHGVLNIVTGPPEEIGATLMAHPAVRKLSFTGSTAVGKQLVQASSANLTRLSLELGGNAPFIVFRDADVDLAVSAAVGAKFRNAGQTCVAANRFLVHEDIYDAFLERFRALVDDLVVGPGTEPGATVGPLIDDETVEKVRTHVEDARRKGATVRTGGFLLPRRPGLADRFYAPTILENWTDSMLLSREETFGPVAPLRSFAENAEAISIANDSPHGLAAYIISRDASLIFRSIESLNYGIIGINDSTTAAPQAPLGGMNLSGFGREGGKYVMDDYTEIKYASWRL